MQIVSGSCRLTGVTTTLDLMQIGKPIERRGNENNLQMERNSADVGAGMLTIEEVIRMAEANNGYCGEDGIRYLREYQANMSYIRNEMENLKTLKDCLKPNKEARKIARSIRKDMKDWREIH